MHKLTYVNTFTMITIKDVLAPAMTNHTEAVSSYSTSHELPGIILGMGSANEKRRYIVTSFLIGRAQTQCDPWWSTWFTLSPVLWEFVKDQFYPKFSGVMLWHCGKHIIVPIPAKQAWMILINVRHWPINTLKPATRNTTKQSTVKPNLNLMV